MLSPITLKIGPASLHDPAEIVHACPRNYLVVVFVEALSVLCVFASFLLLFPSMMLRFFSWKHPKRSCMHAINLFVMLSNGLTVHFDCMQM